MNIIMPLILIAGVTFAAWPAHAATPAAVCARHGTDDTLRPVPADLAAKVNQAFGTSMPASVVAAGTVYRCDGGHVELCTTGANLPCGPADTSRNPSTGALSWCKETPESPFIPAVATGHATIFEWRCRNGAPQIVRQVLSVDRRGFIAQFWKPLP